MQETGQMLKLNGIPHNAICYWTHENKWYAVFRDFENIQESPVGFGDTFSEALNNLRKDLHERFKREDSGGVG